MKQSHVLCAIISLACLPIASSAQSISNRSISKMNSSLTNAINQLYAGYGLNHYDKVIQQPPGIEGSSSRSNAALVLRDAANSQSKKLTSSALDQALVPSAYTMQLLTMCVPGRDFPLELRNNPCNKSNFVSKGLFVTNPDNNAFNMDVLIGPYGYGTKQGKNIDGTIVRYDEAQLAERYIAYAAKYTDIIENPFAGESQEQLKKDIRKPEIQKKIMQLRANAAALSAGLSALYHLYTERVLVKNLASDKGVSSDAPLVSSFFPNYPNASLLQLERYNATIRETNPKWYQAMGTASPAAVERETLYVNAAMLAELFKLRMSIERLNASTSILQLEQSHTAKQFKQLQSQAADRPTADEILGE